jgi:hypothetical protein
MFRRRLVGMVLAGFLFIGVVSMSGRLSYSRGWTDGYFAGQQAPAVAEGGETGETAVPPQAPYRYAPTGYGHFSPVGSVIGGIFKFFFFFMLMSLFFKMLFFRRRWYGSRGAHWHRPPWHHGSHGDEPYEKSPEDVEPDIRSA